jgi:WD40 repeat protein
MRLPCSPDAKLAFDWQNTPLLDALWQLFEPTPYYFTLPQELENVRVNFSIKDADFEIVLRALLDQHQLTFQRKDDRFVITQEKRFVPPSDKVLITLHLKDVWPDEALAKLFAQTPYTYQIDQALVFDKPISIDLPGVPLASALEQLVNLSGLGYIHTGNRYRIYPAPMGLGLHRDPNNPLEKLVSGEFKDRDAKAVLSQILQDSSLTYVIDPGATLSDTVSISFDATPMWEAVNMLLEYISSACIIKGNVIHIVARPAYRDRLYSLADEAGTLPPFEANHVALGDFLSALGLWQVHYDDDDPNLADIPVNAVYTSATPRREVARAVIRSAGLAYKIIDGTYVIARPDRIAAASIDRHLEPGKLEMLYILPYGKSEQLRRRAFPYPGIESLIWESPADGGYTAYLPSPDYHYAVLQRRLENTFIERLLLLDLSTGEIQPLLDGKHVLWVRWEGDDTLATATSSESNNQLTIWQLQPHAEEALHYVSIETYDKTFMAKFETQVKQIKQLADAKKLPFKLQTEGLADVLAEKYQLPRHRGDALSMLFSPRLAVSPDDKCLALSEREGPLYIIDLASGAQLASIPAAAIITGEGVSFDDLRWSADSRYLTFTEQHYHPAEPHGYDISPRPDPTDFTYVVRLYSRTDNKTSTVAFGRDAFLLPVKTP